jgi:hypothetical protein
LRRPTAPSILKARQRPQQDKPHPQETLLDWNLQEILAFATNIRPGADAEPTVLSVSTDYENIQIPKEGKS